MALIVENGVGLTEADSYVSVAEADAYFEAYPNDNWQGETTDKEVALRRASRDLDLVFGPQYIGVTKTVDQGLLFPRLGDLLVNNRVKRATFELAALSMAGYSPIDLADDAGVTEFTYKVEGVYGETVKYGNGRSSQPELNRVRLILSSLLAAEPTDNSFNMLHIVRG